MRVAPDLDHLAAGVDAVVAAERIGLEITTITLEKLAWPVARPAHREVEDVEWVLEIPPVDPEPARGLDLPLRVPHLHRRVVSVDHAAEQDQRLHQIVQRLEPLGGAAHPVAEGRPRDLDTLPLQPALLAIERDMVGILIGNHMSQEPRPGQALGDGLGRLIRGDDVAFTVWAGVGTAHDVPRRTATPAGNRVARYTRRRSGLGARHIRDNGARPRSGHGGPGPDGDP